MSLLIEALQAGCPGLRAEEPLSRHTSLGVGGPAEYYVDVNTRDELVFLRRTATQHRLPVFFIGAGSNLLVSDRGLRGLVIHLQGDFRRWSIEGQDVIAGSAAWMPALSKQCAEKGLSGLEPLIGVPGTVGGGLIMNAGTHEGELGQVVRAVEVLEADGTARWREREAIEFRYRYSNLEGAWLLAARLKLTPADPAAIVARIETHLQHRARTQPLATSNCGSVFKNPPGQSAGRLIEEAGLKGQAAGGARISDRHANFILNEKNATAGDVLELIRRVQTKVRERSGITLETEVKLIGEFADNRGGH